MTGRIGPPEGVPRGPRPCDLIAALLADGATVATAESITGGRVVAALTSVAGSSAVVRGAVVAYASDVKSSTLGVDPAVLGTHGPVSAVVVEQMAQGVRARLVATYGVATTGEAGPDSATGNPIGTVLISVAGPLGSTTRQLLAAGTREQIQQQAVTGALELLAEVLVAGRSGHGSASGTELGNNGD